MKFALAILTLAAASLGGCASQPRQDDAQSDGAPGSWFPIWMCFTGQTQVKAPDPADPSMKADKNPPGGPAADGSPTVLNVTPSWWPSNAPADGDAAGSGGGVALSSSIGSGL